MKIVYYASFSEPEFSGSHYLLFQEPDSLLKTVAAERNKNNKFENYIDCPGFQNSVKNTFIVRNSLDMSLLINDNGIFPTDEASTTASSFWLRKQNSRQQLGVVNYYLNYIFFSKDMEISTLPAYLHTTDFQTKLTYIPGSFNVGNWFRPVEGAFEMKTDNIELNCNVGDPMYYIKFHTNEKIKFVRFNFTPKLYQMTMGCMNYKKLKLHSSLKFLYKLFHNSLANKIIEREIKDNIIK